jgi:tripartite-type tricarboxylate transporter receptor subunit TctC
LNRMHLLRSLLGGLALAIAPALAGAQPFPAKPITVIAPFAAGGSADGIARLVARELQQALGQPVVVDNKPGAGGATGLLLVAKAAPDGYTIGIGATGAIAIGPHLPDAPPLSPDKQLQPLAKIADIPLVIAAGAKSGITDLQGLIQQARTAEVPLGNAGQYTAHHLSGELIASTARIRVPAVPYRGSAPAVNDLLGGQVPVAIVDLTAVAPHIKAGTVKALAVTSATRSKLAPEIPTVAESGVPGYAAPAWMGLFAPQGLPAAVNERYARELRAILDKPEVQQQIMALAAEPAYLDAARFAAFIDTESKRWARVIATIPKPQK